MRKKVILIGFILLAIIGIIVGIAIFSNQEKINYNRLYLNSLEFDGRLAEYTFKPDVNDEGIYKIKFKVKDELRDNICISLYKLEDDKELNIKLNNELESEEIEKLNELNLKLVVYVKKTYNLLDKDYIDIGFLSINNAN